MRLRDRKGWKVISKMEFTLNEVRELEGGGWADFVSPCGLGRAWIFKVK